MEEAMKRIIKDYKSIDNDLLMKINSLYPDGIGEEDLISYTNTKGETIRAIELKTDDTIYLIKMSIQLEQKLEEFTIEEPKVDDNLEDYFDMEPEPEEVTDDDKVSVDDAVEIDDIDDLDDDVVMDDEPIDDFDEDEYEDKEEDEE